MSLYWTSLTLSCQIPLFPFCIPCTLHDQNLPRHLKAYHDNQTPLKQQQHTHTSWILAVVSLPNCRSSCVRLSPPARYQSVTISPSYVYKWLVVAWKKCTLDHDNPFSLVSPLHPTSVSPSISSPFFFNFASIQVHVPKMTYPEGPHPTFQVKSADLLAPFVVVFVMKPYRILIHIWLLQLNCFFPHIMSREWVTLDL